MGFNEWEEIKENIQPPAIKIKTLSPSESFPIGVSMKCFAEYVVIGLRSEEPLNPINLEDMITIHSQCEGHTDLEPVSKLDNGCDNLFKLVNGDEFYIFREGENIKCTFQKKFKYIPIIYSPLLQKFPCKVEYRSFKTVEDLDYGTLCNNPLSCPILKGCVFCKRVDKAAKLIYKLTDIPIITSENISGGETIT